MECLSVSIKWVARWHPRESVGIYMVTDVQKAHCFYVGQVYFQDFIVRLRQHARGLLARKLREVHDDAIQVKFGRIELPTEARLTSKRVDEIEAALIRFCKHVYPTFLNIRNTRSYWGRNYSISNTGCFHPLPKSLDIFRRGRKVGFRWDK